MHETDPSSQSWEGTNPGFVASRTVTQYISVS
jgi:hypothetical protein